MTPARPSQFPLALEFLPSHGRDDFLITSCNQAAAALVDSWPDWPTPHAIVYGPAGSGKTHLLSVWSNKANAVELSAETLGDVPVADQLGDGRAWVLDRLDAVRDETQLFHLWNLVRERNGALLAACRNAPSRLPFHLPDLTSRLAASTIVEILAPDDALLGALLVKLFQDRHLTVDPSVISFLQLRLERTFAAYRDAVQAIDRAGLAARRKVTVPLVRQVLFAEA